MYSTFVPIAKAGHYGPVGGIGGNSFFYESPSGSFSEIIIRHGKRIDSLQFNGGGRGSSFYGGRGGRLDWIDIGGKCITAIKGTIDIARNHRKTSSIFSLEFIFSNGTRTDRFGRDGQNFFALKAPPGEEITGFFGRHGREIDAIGIVTSSMRSNCPR